MPSVASSIDAYVESLGGKHPIRKILIANNGIAAVKAIRSIRRWAYETFGDERAVLFVAMATAEDVSANAEYVRMADIWTSVPGGSNNKNFANVALITDLAVRFSCDAVWAGWGHASENPALPDNLSKNGIIFLGPSPDSMHALGDKIASSIIAQSAGVPTVSWSGSGLTVSYSKEGEVPEHVYAKACVTDADHARNVAQQCGYPLVVKASEGGGGKGIRVVHDESQICTAYRQVAGEVPGSPIFLMRLVEDARHLEVQVVADEYGDALALYGRDCSVQRRHQKIIEEGPVVAAPPDVWKRLESAAVALAKEVGYVGAGTVEYLYKGDTSGGEFYFLELNPRLQVEHPVTEWITGVNLPALQLHIGMGIPLKHVASVRKFLGLPPMTSLADVESSTPVSLPGTAISSPVGSIMATPSAPDCAVSAMEPLSLSPVPPMGHVIACRVTAENPDEGFQPTSGAIQELTFRNTPNVWGYFSVGASGGVHEFADSQFGHLFAWGETREASRRCLVLALKELSIRGDIRTTVEYLIKLLEMDAFRENNFNTSWLDKLIANKVVAEKPPTDLAVIIGAVCRAHKDLTEIADRFTKCLERGQLPPLDSSLVVFPVELIYDDVKYSFEVTRSDISSFRVRLSRKSSDHDVNDSILAEVRTLADGAKLVLADGRSHVCYLREEPTGLRMSIAGKTCLFPKEYDPTTLTSSVSGKLVRFLVNSGDHVKAGQAFVELEVMKMYLTLPALESGKITIMGSEGRSVDVGDVLARLELDDPGKVRRAEIFTGNLPKFGDPQARGMRVHQQFERALKDVRLLLMGYDIDSKAIDSLMNCMDDVRVCVGDVREAFSSISGRLPSNVSKSIDLELEKMLEETDIPRNGDAERGEVLNGCFSSKFTAAASKECWLKHTSVISVGIQNIISIASLPEAAEFLEVVKKYANGSILASTMTSLLGVYLETEKHFARRSGSTADSLFALRDTKKDDLSSVVELAASHVRLREKNVTMTKILAVLGRPALSTILAEENPQTSEFKTKLHQLSQLQGPAYTDVALRARITLADLSRPQFQLRRDSVERLLKEVKPGEESESEKSMEQLIQMKDSILDVLMSFILPSSSETVPFSVRAAATKVHILRSFRAYEVEELTADSCGEDTNDCLTLDWRFKLRKEDNISPFSLDTQDYGQMRGPALPRGLQSFDSSDDLTRVPGSANGHSGDDSFRHGLLTTFSNWSSMEASFDEVLDKFSTRHDWSSSKNVNILSVVLRWDSTAPSPAEHEAEIYENEMIDVTQDSTASEAFVSHSISKFCLAKPSRMTTAVECGIKAFTFIVAPDASTESMTYPGFYTFRVQNGFREDSNIRHIDPPMAFQLELSRLSNFSISRYGYPTRAVHVFHAQDKQAFAKSSGRPPLSNGSPPSSDKPKTNVSASGNATKALNGPVPVKVPSEAKKRGAVKDFDARFFVRAVIRYADIYSNSREGPAVSIPEAERTFIDALDALEIARCNRKLDRTDFNHVFLNVIPPVNIELDDVEAICRRMFQRYATRCWSLRVFAVEIRICTSVSTSGEAASLIPLRFHLFNPTGHDLKVESYIESVDPETGIGKLMSVSQNNLGSQHGSPISKPYPIMDRIQRKRLVAQAMETTYVYDFLHIFTKRLQYIWRRYSENRLLGGFHRHKIPMSLLDSTELILKNNSAESSVDSIEDECRLVETDRQAGQNNIGVVVWKCTLRTPEYPNGRDVIVIANDITFRSGSFGPDEDALFYEASKYARKHGLPRIYLAANSGARIGVAEEVRERLQIDWVDPECPGKGFKHLAIHEHDLKELSPYVKTGKRLGNGLVEITDIIGAEHGLGVENLMGSGLLAGEASRAYDEIFTITYVCARSVGIGAYLVRLGQRVIQKESAAPIILTGYSALNKVLGHEVYLSNDQLGGTKVMHPNGVTHTKVKDDVDGVGEILHWLSYVPAVQGGALPITESIDSVDRNIAVKPPSGGQPYDPRTKLIAGEYAFVGRQKRFWCGLFDKDSWREYLDGWAKTVVVGRARLGGVPTGIVAVETRCVEKLTPADPASPDTREYVVTQAGQVWYPDSAAKTAQAIRDFNREGLPLFILANWRGFSGGMRDMFDEILKPGSQIVDALRNYKQPVFVYIPPGGELRGGAWVVLDTLINPAMIEMYADRHCRGGVLEPEGTVDVKFRRREVVKSMHRLDNEICKLDEEMRGGKGVIVSDDRKKELNEAIFAREGEMLGVYRTIATSFCDLHDTPGRMLEKKAVREIVEWERAREFFYWRLQRRLAEDKLRKKIMDVDNSLSDEDVKGLMKKWAAEYYYMEKGMNGHAVDEDEKGNSQIDVNHESDNESEDVERDDELRFERDDRWVYQWLEVDEVAIEKKVQKIRMAQISDRISQCFVDNKEGFMNGIEKVLRECPSSSERARIVAGIEAKINLVTASRGVSLSSSLGILGRLGKLSFGETTNINPKLSTDANQGPSSS